VLQHRITSVNLQSDDSHARHSGGLLSLARVWLQSAGWSDASWGTTGKPFVTVSVVRPQFPIL